MEDQANQLVPASQMTGAEQQQRLRIEELTKTVKDQQEQLVQLKEDDQEYQELRQVYQEQQHIIDGLGAHNQELQYQLQQATESQAGRNYAHSASKELQNSGISIGQYEQLVMENEKLKYQLGDMIDKYKILYAKIKELQEERQRERQLEQQKRAESSVNPFSIASTTMVSNNGELKEEQTHQSQMSEQIQLKSSKLKKSADGKKMQNKDSERGQDEQEGQQRHQSGGSNEAAQMQHSKMVDASTSPPKRPDGSLASSQNSQSQRNDQQRKLQKDRMDASMTSQQSSAQKNWRGSNQSSILPTYQQNVQLQKQIKQLMILQSDQEQELISAKVQWATQELECDKLRHALAIHQEREEKLAAEKFESTLKLSILEKQNQIEAQSKQKKQIKPSITKIGKLFKFPATSKISGKTSKHIGTSAAGQESFRDNAYATGSPRSSSRGGNTDEVGSALGSAKGHAGGTSTGAGAGAVALSSKRSEQQQSGNF